MAQNPFDRKKLSFKVTNGEKNETPKGEFMLDKDGKMTTNTIDAFCKRVDYENRPSIHFIKFKNYGQQAGMILNPIDPFYKVTDIREFDSERGKFMYEFRTVTQAAFDQYSVFLLTKNPARIATAMGLTANNG